MDFPIFSKSIPLLWMDLIEWEKLAKGSFRIKWAIFQSVLELLSVHYASTNFGFQFSPSS